MPINCLVLIFVTRPAKINHVGAQKLPHFFDFAAHFSYGNKITIAEIDGESYEAYRMEISIAKHKILLNNQLPYFLN